MDVLGEHTGSRALRLIPKGRALFAIPMPLGMFPEMGGRSAYRRYSAIPAVSERLPVPARIRACRPHVGR
jgi:hypothetical protein